MTEDADTRTDSPSTGGVKAVETSLTIVEALREMGGGRVTDVVDRTGLSKGAVYKHLTTLTAHDLVVKEGNDYHLGFRFLDYGGWLRSRYVGSELIKPQMRELADETGEVAHFAIREKGRVITLFRENGTQGVFTRTRLGRRLHLHQTAGGKTLLAHLPPSEAESIVASEGLPSATENTITDEAELFAELEAVRERGFAVNREESTSGVVAVAVPLAPDDTVVGACSVAGPRHRMSDDRIEGELVDLLSSVVTELELNITHSHGPVGKFCPRE